MQRIWNLLNSISKIAIHPNCHLQSSSSDPHLVESPNPPILGTSGSPPFHYPKTMNFKDITVKDLGLTQQEIDDTHEHMYTYHTNLEIPCPPECGSLPDPVVKLLGQLKNYLTQLEDPLDERILTTLKEISALSQDPRDDLSRRYKHLVTLVGDDLLTIMDELVEICMMGPKTLIMSLKFATVAYTAALARNAKDTVHDIATTATDMRAMIENIADQQQNFLQSVEHLSLAWNNVTASMTGYTAEIDRKTLILTNMASNTRGAQTRAPSTVSDYSADPQVGAKLIITPGFQYTSDLGTLTYTETGNLGFSSTGSGGVALGRIVEAVKKVKPLEIILNKDLNQLLCYVKSEDSLLTTYSTASVDVKRQILDRLNQKVPDLCNQWVKKDIN